MEVNGTGSVTQQSLGRYSLVITIHTSAMFDLVSFLFSHWVTLLKASGLLICYWLFTSKNSTAKARLPPGPRPLPIIGNILSLSDLPHLTFSKWADKYGPIFKCFFGRHMVIVLNDAELIRKALWMPEFSNRPSLYTTKVTSDGLGMVFASDDTWEIHRRFFKGTLKKLSSGSNVVLQSINEECENLIRQFQQTEGKPFSCKPLVQTAVGNVICSVLFGQLLEHSGINILDFHEEMRVVSSWFALVGALNIFPVLRFFPGVRKGWKAVLQALERGGSFVTAIIKQHENGASTDISDFTDALISAREEDEVKHGAPQIFSDRQIVAQLRELFTVANDATASALRWALLYMVTHPEVQVKVQEELDRVVGTSRAVTLDDMQRMPYTQAVLNECHRMSTVAPLAVPHRASRDIVFHGYFIPKDAWIVPNLAHVHSDAACWDEPQAFRPERFLSVEGKVVTPRNFIPFGVGKRVCPGESLARMEVSLMFARLLQQFQLQAVGDIDLSPVNGIALEAKDFRITCEHRFTTTVQPSG